MYFHMVDAKQPERMDKNMNPKLVNKDMRKSLNITGCHND